MKKTNKLISILLVVAMLLSMAPVTVFAASVVASGKFGASGSNLTWSLDSDGVLTVSGSGAMEDFASVSKVPWYSKRTNVKTVVIESGVTNIGKDAFYGISSLVNATISDTVTSIGNRAFSGSGLTNFEFSDAGNLKTIGNAAFSNTKIKSMVIPDGVTTLGSYIFGYGPIQSVTIPASVTSIGNYFFEETSSLNEVIFLGNKEPENVGNTVFLGCSSLAYVSVPADYEGDTFSNMKVAKAVASVAEVNGQGFATLADAISAAQSINGAELKLLSHISIDSGITIESGKFTIDLNGKELFSNGYYVLRVDGADVTIVDSAGGGIFNATNDQGNIVLEVLSGSANISGGTFNSAGYPATVRDGTLMLTGKDFVLNGNWRIGWYGGSIDLSACTADEVRIQACADGLLASAVTLPDGWGLFETDGTPCTDFVKYDIYVAKAGYKVTVSVNPAEGGTVDGAGAYGSGATVNLTASAANGYRFVNWIENGEEVSTSAVYTFTASKNRELTANFEIVPHTHSFTYSASGDTITAICENTDGRCPDSEGTLTISAPADLYADGTTAKEAVVDNRLVENVDYTVTYSTADGNAPKTAGTYTASVTLGGATASVQFTLLSYAAKVTDKDGNELLGSPYKTFADAVTAAEGSEGGTLTLLDDVTLTAEQNIRSGKFTLDLNGKKLINVTGRVLYIYEEADLTIKDSGETGTLEYPNTGDYAIWNYGTLTVESGVIKGDGGIKNYGTLTFKDGMMEAVTYSTIYNTGMAYVYDGVLKNVKSSAVGNFGTIYVYDGEIDGVLNKGTAYISGGKIDCDNYAALNLLGGTVEVTGGSFTGTNNEYGYYGGTPYGEFTVYYSEDTALTLKGGEFPNGFVVAYTTANALLAEGYAFYDKDGNKITVADDATKIEGYVQVKEHFVACVTDKDGNEIGTYKTLADAITAAQDSEGSTLTLLDDYNVSNYVKITSGTFTFDLAGNSLTISGSNTALFVDGSDVNLTIADSIGGGKIYASSMSLHIVAAQCVTINNGIFDGYLSLRNGSLVINGGTFNNGSEGGYSISKSDGSTVAIYGGEFPKGFYLPRTEFLNDYIAEGCYFRDADGKIITVADNISVIRGYVKIEKGAYITDGVITLDATEFTYNGYAIEPTVNVTIGSKTLIKDTDYTLDFAGNTNAGMATVTVTGVGDYKGKATKEFTIAPATVDIIWEGDSFYYTGNPHKVTAKYVDVNGDENPAAITQNKTNTEIGKYIATAKVEDSNYTVNGATINHAYEIKWYDGAPDATVSGTKGENGWYTSAVTVTAPEGYAISTAVDGTYGSEITLGNEENAVYYLKQTENGYIAKVELGEIKSDLADPAAEIAMAENKWNSFFNTVTFGKFFKETQSVTISASDETSGVAKIEYVVSTEEITDFENAEWVEYTDAFNIEPNSKNIIYAKATDNAGRYVIVNSDGIVLYTDSTLDTSFKDEVVYVLTKNAAQAFNLNLNGNTVAYVKIDETVLGEEDYEVLGNMIMVSDEVLENLAAGEYIITVGFNPMGEAFAEGDAPAEVTIPLTVKKADVTVEINDFGKVYDGKPVTADYKISKSSDSSPAASSIDYNETVEFKVKGTNDGTYTTEVPVNAGEYTVRITVAETDKISAAEATEDFTIAKKPVTVTATAPDKVYDGTTDILEYSKVIVKLDGAVEGEMLGYTVGKAWYNSADAGTDNTVHIIYAPVASNSVDNYEFPMNPEYSTDNCYVAAKADISRKDISDGFIILGKALTYNGKEQTQTVEKVLPTGTAPEATYTVSGNKATNVGVYLLTVTGTGNFTGEAKIAYEIAVDMNGVDFDQLHPLNVKATDREKIEYIYNQLDNAFRDYADAEKRNEWDNNKSYCVELLKMIESVANHIESFENDLAKYDINTVTSDDDADLESFQNSVGYFYDYYFDNLTDEQEKKTSDIFWAIEKLEIRISDVAKEITRITNAVNSYDEATVKSSDKADLEQLKANIKALTDGQNITDNEREKLAELDAKLDALLKIIADTQAEIDELGKNADSYAEETVKSSDSDELAQLKEDIQSLIDGGNTTDAEKSALEEVIKEIEALEDKIDETAKEIERIENAVNGYDEESIKSSDKEAVDQLKEDIQSLIDSGNVTEEEIAGLEETKADADALTDKIDETQSEIDRVNDAVAGYDEESVKSTDTEAIEQLKEDIQTLIDSGNVTEEEIAGLEETKADADALTDKIAETEQQLEEIKGIENNYNPENVSSDDKAAIEDKIAEIEAVNPDNLTDEQKAEYEEIKAGFEALLEEIAAAEKAVEDIGIELEMFDEKRVTIFWEDDIEALKAKIDELLADENMGETEKSKLNDYKAQCDNLIEIIHNPCKYFSLRFFYFIWDCLTWKYNGILWLFSKIFG